MTVAEALAAGAALRLARLDAQLLLLRALGRDAAGRAWLLAHDDHVLTPQQEAGFMALCERRRSGEPVAYLLGHKEFHGLRLQVDRRVLVPRPDTETLVDWALELLECTGPSSPRRRGSTVPDSRAARVDGGPQGQDGDGPGPRVIDLGTGSGAIALALKSACPAAQVTGIDASEDALAVARSNATALGLAVGFRHGNWLDGVDGCFELIVSNPPYVAEGDPHLAQLGHEPIAALAAGPDGLDAIRSIVAQTQRRLAPGGWLLLEHGWQQAGPVRALLAAAGFSDVQSRRDLAGIERCSGGRRIELG